MPQKIEAVINDYNKYVDELLLACLQLASPTRRIQVFFFKFYKKLKFFRILFCV